MKWVPCARVAPLRHGAGERTRTSDPRITNALLYQLSYSGVEGGYVKQTGRRGQCRGLTGLPEGTSSDDASGQAGCASAAAAAIISRLCSVGEPWLISISPSLREFSTTSLPRS
jgi:hypothetical protein